MSVIGEGWIEMSDDFAVCPRCRILNAQFLHDGEGKIRCVDCGGEVEKSEIMWKHVEYGKDD